MLVYLTEAAASATFGCVAAYSAPGSRFAFTYASAELLRDRSPEVLRERRLVRLLGEPFRFGFEPGSLEPWLSAHGFRLVSDESFDAIASRLLRPNRAARVRKSALRRRRHVAVVERVG